MWHKHKMEELNFMNELFLSFEAKIIANCWDENLQIWFLFENSCMFAVGLAFREFETTGDI